MLKEHNYQTLDDLKKICYFIIMISWSNIFVSHTFSTRKMNFLEFFFNSLPGKHRIKYIKPNLKIIQVYN